MKRLFISAMLFPIYLSIGSATYRADSINTRDRQRYELFVQAAIRTESAGNPYAMGVNHDVGILQITPVLLRDYNQRTGNHYMMYNVIDPQLSRKVFDYYARGRSFECAARCWNGGPRGMQKQKTFDYWIRIITNI